VTAAGASRAPKLRRHTAWACTAPGRLPKGYQGAPQQQQPEAQGASKAPFPASSAPFCIIEDGSTLDSFESLSAEELNSSIESRRNDIFRLMEEVRRLRVQQKVRAAAPDGSDLLSFSSAIPLFPDLTGAEKLKDYYKIFGFLIACLIVFGGIVAPTVEMKLGIGGTSYAEVIRQLHLPDQLARVDPIVASFTGGAVGVLTALLLVEMNNVEQVSRERCVYCSGTGYLPCGNCGGTGVDGGKCGQCGGSGKVMCPSCLCTGMALATEHDPRIDPFTLEADPRGGEELSPFLTGIVSAEKK
jgi:hypothetical protein